MKTKNDRQPLPVKLRHIKKRCTRLRLWVLWDLSPSITYVGPCILFHIWSHNVITTTDSMTFLLEKKYSLYILFCIDQIIKISLCQKLTWRPVQMDLEFYFIFQYTILCFNSRHLFKNKKLMIDIIFNTICMYILF